ncbi:MAG: hypothetical protein ACO1TE_15265 [Prosthecobacter sp.]
MSHSSQLKFLFLTAVLVMTGCAWQRPDVRAVRVLTGAEVTQAEHLVDDDSTVVLVIRAQDGRLWSIRNTLSRPQQAVFADANGRLWKTNLDPEVARLLLRIMEKDFMRIARKQAPADHDETWRLRTFGEWHKRLIRMRGGCLPVLMR